MIALKKVYGDELLRLALVLSLIRADPNGYLTQDALQLSAGLNLSNGTWTQEHEPRTFARPRFVHPKSLDNVLLEYEREVFAELNSLGGYNRNARAAGTYCVNNFVECRAAQALQNGDNPTDNQESAAAAFGVSDDDNVAGEVHLPTCDADEGTAEADQHKPSEEATPEPEPAHEAPPDAAAFADATEPPGDAFDRFVLDAKTFDVSEFFAAPSNMHVKKEEPDMEEVRVKVENDDLFETLPHYFERLKKYSGLSNDDDSIFDQNLSDLRDYSETVDTLESFRRGFEYLDVKDQNNDLEKYLLENTQIDLEKYGGFKFDLGVKRERASTSFTFAGSSGLSEMDAFTDIKTESEDDEHVNNRSGDELTQEDMDLIEVLWKQDVDMGFTLENPANLTPVDEAKLATEKECAAKHPPSSSPPPTIQPDEIRKLKHRLISDACSAAIAIHDDTDEELAKKEVPSPAEDPWAGLSYTIDTETGEYIIQGELPSDLVSDEDPGNDCFDLIEEALQLVGLDESSAVSIQEDPIVTKDENATPIEDRPNPLDGPLSGIDERDDMLHPGVGVGRNPPHHAHHTLHQHYHHQSLVRQMSMEQRWQDLASLLAIAPPESQHHLNHSHHLNHLNHLNHTHQPYHHHAYAGGVPNHHPYAGQHGAGPPSHLGPSAGPYPGSYGAPLAPPPPTEKTDLYTPTLVDHQPPQPMPPSVGVYKNPVSSGGSGGPHHHDVAAVPHPHDSAMFYQNSTSDINGTSDGFLSSILNDEDLQLMDMAVNEGMYTMRMLDGSGSQQLQSGIGGAGAPLAPPPHHQYPAAHHGYGNLAPNVGHHITPVSTSLGSTHLNMGNERMDSSSDSAVSSMGSERVPSLSDGEWCDGGSDSAQEYHSSKFRPYTSYGRNGPDGLNGSNGPTSNATQAPPQRHHTPPVAQKKHHMFGKRCFQEQSSPILDPIAEVPRPRDVKYEFDQAQLPYGASQDIGGVAMPPEMKYSCTLEFAAASRPSVLGGPPPTTPLLPLVGGPVERARVAHNHTYGAPPEHAGGLPLRPQARDKRARRLTDASDCSGSGGSSAGSQQTRDEKRAKALGIPLPVQEIINLPMDEFNERLSKHDLSEAQLSLIRDIRRRGKNKVAAQNCRKRKLEQITSLEDEVRTVRDRKTRLQRERLSLTTERQRVKDRFTMLYHHVFQHLHDSDGNPLSSHQYSLQQAADGAVVLVPRAQMSQGSHSMHGQASLRPGGDDDHHNMSRTSDDEIERYKAKQQRKNFDQ